MDGAWPGLWKIYCKLLGKKGLGEKTWAVVFPETAGAAAATGNMEAGLAPCR